MGTANRADVLHPPDKLRQPGLAADASVKPDRSAEDTLFEVMTGAGIEPAAPLAAEKIDGHEVFTVDGGALIACLSPAVPVTVVREIARRSPRYAAFLHAGFATDADREAAGRLLAESVPGTKVLVI